MIILTYPNNILSQKSKEVLEITPQIKMLIANMRKTLQLSGGIGLAAPQVGELKRIVLVFDESNKPVVMINPIIVSHSNDTTDSREGCLSTPKKYCNVKRWYFINVKYTDIDGNNVEQLLTDRTAIIAQHEIDHLDGIIILDKKEN